MVHNAFCVYQKGDITNKDVNLSTITVSLQEKWVVLTHFGYLNTFLHHWRIHYQSSLPWHLLMFWKI